MHTNIQAARTWSAGDFARIGCWYSIVGELLCESADLRAGEHVLDVATGTGNTAIAAARRMCRVTGIDCTPVLLERARRRARSEGFDVRFELGDAMDLPVPTAEYDAVLSSFGCMFAEDNRKAAAELARACRPDGRIGVASWTVGGFIGMTLRICCAVVHPPTFPSALAWGDEQELHAMLGPYSSSIQIARRVFWFRHHSAESWLEVMKICYGPLVVLWNELDRDRQESLDRELLSAIRYANHDRTGKLLLPAEYLEAVIVRN